MTLNLTPDVADHAAPKRPRLFKPWMIPAGFLALLFVASIGVYFAANSSGADQSQPTLKPFAGPLSDTPTLAFDVSGVAGGKLSLAAGAKGANTAALDLQPAADLRAEILAPAAAADIRLGDDIVIVGVPNEVRSFAIRLIIIVPAELRQASGELSAGGFAGHEAERDQTERVVLRGKITAASATKLSVTSGGADVTFDLTPAAPLRKMKVGTTADIRSSDRIALHATADGKPDATKPILVLTGGAQ